MPFLVSGGIICDPHRGSFQPRSRGLSSSGKMRDPENEVGIICGSGSFAVQFGNHLRSEIICGAVQTSIALYNRTTRININRININPNGYYNPVIDYYNPVIDYYNPLLRFEPCLNQLGLILI